MRIVFLHIIIIISVLISQENKLENYHISLRLHENLINSYPEIVRLILVPFQIKMRNIKKADLIKKLVKIKFYQL